MINRRHLLGAAGAGAAIAGGLALPRMLGAHGDAEALELAPALPDGTRAAAVLDTLPGKKPLIKLSYRPPNYETPVELLGSNGITPNDAFFVRYHITDIPEVDAKTWKLK